MTDEPGAAPGRRERWVALVVVLLGQFMISGGVGVMNIALPSVKDDLGASDAPRTTTTFSPGPTA